MLSVNVMGIFHRVLKPVIDFVMSVPEEHAQITPVSSLIEELPCGCRSQPAIPATPRATQSDGMYSRNP